MEKGIGIIGCGSRMRDVLELLFVENPNLRIVAMYDPNDLAVKKYLELFGNNIKICKNYEEVIKEKNVDWIFIGSINSVHKEQVVKSLKSRKNIFCEKPLAISLKECLEIKKAYEKNGKNFLISYPLRYSPHYLKIKKLINEGKIGKIISFEFNEVLGFNHGSFIMTDWRRFNKYSGGHLLEKCCHDLDLANWIIGSLPKKVASFGGLNCFVDENKDVYDFVKKMQGDIKYDDKILPDPFTSEKDIVDNQVVIIEYKNGVRATFHTNCNSGIPERRMYICGTRGTIKADLVTEEIEINYTGEYDRNKIIKFIGEEETGHGGGDGYIAKQINSAILIDKKPIATIEDALKSTVTALAIEEARKKSEVVDLDKIWKKFGFVN